MAWGVLQTKNGKKYKIDDFRFIGSGPNFMVEILTAVSHKILFIPFSDVERIEERWPSGREWILCQDKDKTKR